MRSEKEKWIRLKRGFESAHKKGLVALKKDRKSIERAAEVGLQLIESAWPIAQLPQNRARHEKDAEIVRKKWALIRKKQRELARRSKAH